MDDKKENVVDAEVENTKVEAVGNEDVNGKNELQERAQAFLDDYKALVDKHKMDFASYPIWVPDGQGGFKTIIQNTPVDTTNMPVKSPFVAQ